MIWKTIPHPKSAPTYPIRINRFLALQKIATRTGADILIEKGAVKINDKTATLGDKVLARDIISVQANLKEKPKVYFAYNKAEGIVTNNPQKGEIEIIQKTRFPKRVFAVGRLDKDSHGLIIMTDDGRITHPLLDPQFVHEKEYEVKVNKVISEKFIDAMGRGIKLDDGYKTKPCQIERTGIKTFRIILTEGKKRQIRRMCEALGYTVEDLKRTRIMNIYLGSLKKGMFRELSGKELDTLLKSLGF